MSDFLSAVRSLYDRAVAEASRAERDRAYRALRLLEALDESVVLVDAELVVEWANNGARSSLGVEPSFPLADPWDEVSLRELAAASLAGDEPTRTDVRCRSGESFDVKTLPLGDAVALVVTETTEREVERDDVRRQTLAAGLELSRALAGIAGGVEALRLGAVNEDGARERFLEDLGHAANRAARLVDGLLAAGGADEETETVSLEPVRLEPVLQHVADDLGLRPGVRVVLDCPAELTALAHRTLLEAVLTAIGEAAARAMTKGAVALSARRLGRSAVAVEATYDGPPPFHHRAPASGDPLDGALAFAEGIVTRLDAELEVERYAQRRVTVRLVLRTAA